jgi:ribosomal biogenesis protein LAS1
MGGARRVPWRDWSEWDRVRSGLCGDDPEARDASIARVADWRRRGRVPHAVDCTASLLETRALDAGVPGNVTGASPRLSAPLSENMLRLAYAAALVRMVNGAVDPSQKGKYAAPVMTLAKRMGIPAVLVDVRMAASHQEMPALALLRHASERALQWLFERYWHAQANQLRELRRGAALAAEDLVAAEAARRVKAERTVSFRKAERGKGKAKTRARNGGVHVEENDDDEKDSEDSESDDDDGDDDDDANANDGDDDAKDAKAGNSPPSPRRARRSATNRLFAAASREDTETCAEALLSVAVGVCRSPDGEPQGSNPTLGDWRAIAARLLKRWPTLDEALLLKAAEAALEPWVAVRDRRLTPIRATLSRARRRRRRICSPRRPRIRRRRRRRRNARAKRNENENVAKEKSDVDARREKTHWYLTRRALAHATASARMTDALRAFVENLVNTAPGAGRSFKAAAARLLGDGSIKKGFLKKVPLENENENENGQKETLASAADEGGGEADDDDAFLAAARRGLAKKRRNAPSGGEDRGGFSRESAAASGVFSKVSDWTPCAVGDLPAHLRRDLGSRRVDAEDALRLAVARAAVSDADAAKAGRRKHGTADLLWARWPSRDARDPERRLRGFRSRVSTQDRLRRRRAVRGRDAPRARRPGPLNRGTRGITSRTKPSPPRARWPREGSSAVRDRRRRGTS